MGRLTSFVLLNSKFSSISPDSFVLNHLLLIFMAFLSFFDSILSYLLLKLLILMIYKDFFENSCLTVGFKVNFKRQGQI